MEEAAREYPTTIWTEIDRVRASGDESAFAALESLLKKYYPPLHRHLLYKFRADSEQASDWLQNFVWKKVLLDNIIAHARSDRGRFRTFLLRALDNFVISQLRGKMPDTVMLDDESLDQAAGASTTDHSDPFDVAWANTVLQQTLSQMQTQCSQDPRGERIWKVFQLRLWEPIINGEEPIPYKKMVELLGFKTDVEAGNTLISAKRMFQEQLRSVIREYAKTKDEVELEIQDLMTIFSTAPVKKE